MGWAPGALGGWQQETVVVAHVPLRFRTFFTADKLDESHDSASYHRLVVRYLGARRKFSNYFNSRLVIGPTHGLRGVDCDGATDFGIPRPIFNILASMEKFINARGGRIEMAFIFRA